MSLPGQRAYAAVAAGARQSQAWDVSGGAGEKWEQELRGRGAWGYHLSKVGNRPADLQPCGHLWAGGSRGVLEEQGRW